MFPPPARSALLYQTDLCVSDTEILGFPENTGRFYIPTGRPKRFGAAGRSYSLEASASI
jgi:hypothetical protein